MRGIPQGYRECPKCRLMTKASVCRCGHQVAGEEEVKTSGSADKAPDTITRKAKQPNKTEASYRTEVLDRQAAIGVLVSIAYEALTVRMANGHRYTPDWVCRTASGLTLCIEVKGTYRMHSHQRARLAFDQAALEWPAWRWIWAEKQTGGGWRIIEPSQPVASTTGQRDASCAVHKASATGRLPPPDEQPGARVLPGQAGRDPSQRKVSECSTVSFQKTTETP